MQAFLQRQDPQPAAVGRQCRFRDYAGKTGKRGRPETFSDVAIQTCLTLKLLFGLPLRVTVGLIESLIQMAGLDWPVPDYSTLCRRQARIAVQVPYRTSGQPLNLLIDSNRPMSTACSATA